MPHERPLEQWLDLLLLWHSSPVQWFNACKDNVNFKQLLQNSNLNTSMERPFQKLLNACFRDNPSTIYRPSKIAAKTAHFQNARPLVLSNLMDFDQSHNSNLNTSSERSSQELLNACFSL